MNIYKYSFFNYCLLIKSFLYSIRPSITFVIGNNPSIFFRKLPNEFSRLVGICVKYTIKRSMKMSIINKSLFMVFQ